MDIGRLGAYERGVVGVVSLDVGGQGLLGAEDGATHVCFLDVFVLDADAEKGVCVWDAVEDYGFWVRGIEEPG